MIPEWLNPGGLVDGPGIVVVLFGIGAIIGTLGGLFGIGGAFLLTPILGELVFGKLLGRPPEVAYSYATGSAACHALGIATTSLRRHLRIGGVNWGLGFGIAAGASVGALGGSTVNGLLKGSPQFPIICQIIQIVVLTLIAILIIRPARPGARAPLQKLPVGPRWPVPGEPSKTFSIPGAFVLFLLGGLVAGFLGITGVVYLPMLILAVGAQPHNALRVSLIVSACSALVSTAKFAWSEQVNLLVVLSLICGSALGVQFGAMLCQRFHGDRLKKYFSIVVLVAMAIVIRGLVLTLTAG